MIEGSQYNLFSVPDLRLKLKKLWKDAFGDDDAYVDSFFSCFAPERYAHFLSLNDRIVSVLYALPYRVHLQDGRELPAAYIYAVATDEKFRGCGYMSQLMRCVHARLRAQGCAAALIIPAEQWLWSYYAKFGYDVCSWRSVTSLSVSQTGICGYDFISVVEPADDELSFVLSQMGKRRNNVVHPRESVIANVADCRLSGGGFYVVRDKRCNVVAAAFVICDASSPVILDFFATDEVAKSYLVNSLCEAFATESVACLSSAGNDAEPFAMMLRFDNSLPDAIGMQLMLDR